MAHELQAKILRVLQDRVVTPVGGRRPTKVDVRILAATHQDLETMVRSGRFREDLYYRLRELEIVLTPLRDRLADLGLFCERFLAEAAEELGYPESQRIHPDTIGRLQKHPWRGNIRELRHAIKGAALRAAGGMLLPSHLDLDRYELHLAAAAAGSAVLNVAASVPSGVPAEVGNSLTWKERLEAQEKMRCSAPWKPRAAI